MKRLDKFIDETNLTGGANYLDQLKQKLKMVLSRYVYYAYQRQVTYLENVAYAREQLDRLSPDAIAQLTARETGKLTEKRKRKMQRYPIEQTPQGQVIPLVEAVIQQYGGIKTIVDVGVRYAFEDHALAMLHPDVDVTGISFATNVEAYHAEFQRPNLRFVTGYALDLLESGTIHGDIVLFNLTATNIRNQELRRYLAHLARTTPFVVFNEPIYNDWNYRVVNPDAVPLDVSVPALEMSHTLIHNYRAMAAEAGFKAVHYHVFPAPTKEFYPLGKIHLLNMIALNPRVVDATSATKARYEVTK